MHLIDTAQYASLLPTLDATPLNTLFARAVLTQQVDGKVYADQPQQPRIIFIEHPYGMALLLGKSDDPAVEEWLLRRALNLDGEREMPMWLQCFPRDWDVRLVGRFAGTAIEVQTRVNFRFHAERFLAVAEEPLPDGVEVKAANEAAFHQMPGAVVPRHFWRTAEDFLARGAGSCLYQRGKLASMAFIAVGNGPDQEIGIETAPEARGLGHAERVCRALIHQLLARGQTPIWACRKENAGSYRLAHRLGFEPSVELPYYLLPA